MAKPLFTEKEISDLEKKITSIQKDRVNYPNWSDQDTAIKNINGAYYAQMISRIRNGRIDDFLNILLIFVGTKGARLEISLKEGFADADKPAYRKLVEENDTPLNRRYLHMYLRAVIVAYRSWAVAAFIKFLRGNKVAGGKANQLPEFGCFHKDSGWTEAEVRKIGKVLFDDSSLVCKLFMEYDDDMYSKVYAALDENEKIPYDACFKAVNKTVNTAFLEELTTALETRGLAPMPTAQKKKFKQHVPKVFKPGDTIRMATIQDLPAMAIIELQAYSQDGYKAPKNPVTVQVVLVEPPQPRCYMRVWRIVDGKAYVADSYFDFDGDRKSYDGAIYKGQWDAGVQNPRNRHNYPGRYFSVNNKY